jgi:hypothetical protein
MALVLPPVASIVAFYFTRKRRPWIRILAPAAPWLVFGVFSPWLVPVFFLPPLAVAGAAHAARRKPLWVRVSICAAAFVSAAIISICPCLIASVVLGRSCLDGYALYTADQLNGRRSPEHSAPAFLECVSKGERIRLIHYVDKGGPGNMTVVGLFRVRVPVAELRNRVSLQCPELSFRKSADAMVDFMGDTLETQGRCFEYDGEDTLWIRMAALDDRWTLVATCYHVDVW